MALQRREVIGTPGHSPGRALCMHERVRVSLCTRISTALQYEVRLAEADSRSGNGGLTAERIDLCFSILGGMALPIPPSYTAVDKTLPPPRR